jgi:hypothetical protein
MNPLARERQSVDALEHSRSLVQPAPLLLHRRAQRVLQTACSFFLLAGTAPTLHSSERKTKSQQGGRRDGSKSNDSRSSGTRVRRSQVLCFPSSRPGPAHLASGHDPDRSALPANVTTNAASSRLGCVCTTPAPGCPLSGKLTCSVVAQLARLALPVHSTPRPLHCHTSNHCSNPWDREPAAARSASIWKHQLLHHRPAAGRSRRRPPAASQPVRSWPVAAAQTQTQTQPRMVAGLRLLRLCCRRRRRRRRRLCTLRPQRTFCCTLLFFCVGCCLFLLRCVAAATTTGTALSGPAATLLAHCSFFISSLHARSTTVSPRRLAARCLLSRQTSAARCSPACSALRRPRTADGIGPRHRRRCSRISAASWACWTPGKLPSATSCEPPTACSPCAWSLHSLAFLRPGHSKQTLKYSVAQVPLPFMLPKFPFSPCSS